MKYILSLVLLVFVSNGFCDVPDAKTAKEKSVAATARIKENLERSIASHVEYEINKAIHNGLSIAIISYKDEGDDICKIQIEHIKNFVIPNLMKLGYKVNFVNFKSSYQLDVQW